MNTQIFTIDRDKPDDHMLKKAADILKKGGLVAFPTETVYGLGANGLDEKAAAGIYRAKGRPSDNPLILHIADKDEIHNLVSKITPNACLLMDKYWPGPLTIILPRAGIVPDVITGGLDTVAVRLPASIAARRLIALAGIPLAAPSANTSGRPSPTTAQMVLADLDGKIDAIIDAGPCDVGLESTIVDCTTVVPTLLRPGGITLEMLTETLGAVEIDPGLEMKDAVPKAPGMKYTHYAPKAPMTLFEGEHSRIVEALKQKAAEAKAAGQKVGAVVSVETAAFLPSEVTAAVYGSRVDAGQAAANLYSALRRFDDMHVDVIVAEGIAEDGLGLAVMNRMRKACGYRIIRV